MTASGLFPHRKGGSLAQTLHAAPTTAAYSMMTLSSPPAPVMIPPLPSVASDSNHPSEKRIAAIVQILSSWPYTCLAFLWTKMPIGWTCDAITTASTSIISSTCRECLPPDVRNNSASSIGLPRAVSLQRGPASCATFAVLFVASLCGRRLFVPGGKIVQNVQHTHDAQAAMQIPCLRPRSA